MLHSYKLQTTLATVCYALVLLGSLVLAVQMTVLFHTDGTEGLGGAVVKIAAALLGIVGGIFAVLSLIPFSLRLISVKKQSRALVAICTVFDFLFVSVGFVVVLDAILGGYYEFATYALGILVVIIAGFAAFCNVLSLRHLTRAKRGRRLACEANEN